MAQIEPLVITLKKQLKAHGLTYADVAQTLDLSEASVKRLFAEKAFTLQRLEAIAEMINLQISDLVEIMLQEKPQLVQLTEIHEQEIISDHLLLMIAVTVMNGMSYADIMEKYSISNTDCIQKLAKLDRLKIIELLPNNRIKLLIAPNFRWIPNGPIQQFFKRQLEREFFSRRFDKDSEKLIVMNCLLTQKSTLEIKRRLESLAQDINHTIKEDMPTHYTEKHGSTVVMALSSWNYSMFDKFHKP